MQIDNSALAVKLELRRYFLRKYNHEQVIDCCEGSGVIWDILSKEFQGRRWGLDIKKQPGRLKLDSVRLLSQAGWSADVIDVDTYGTPWRHWYAMLPNVRAPITVFLTSSILNISTLDRETRRVLGLGDIQYPRGNITASLRRIAPDWHIAEAYAHGLEVSDIVEGFPHSQHMRYLGLRLSPVSG